jgi:DNA invertase Pin-like site-specific DNA recombinase
LPYQNVMKQKEREFNEPMEVLLPRLLNDLKKISKVAEALDVSVQTLWRWRQELNIELDCHWQATPTPPDARPLVPASKGSAK